METDKKSNGAFIGLIIIIIILIVGGIYIWMLNKNASEKIQSPQSATVSNQDAATLNSLDTDIQNSDTNVGDTNSVN